MSTLKSEQLKKRTNTTGKVLWTLLSMGVATTILYCITGIALFMLGGFVLVMLALGCTFALIELETKLKRTLAAQQEQEKLRRKSQQTSNLERARTWQYELVGLPSLKTRPFGRALSLYFPVGRTILRSAVQLSPGTLLTLRLLPQYVEMREPLLHQIAANRLFESPLPSRQPTVRFPLAQINGDGTILNYGPVAVLYGTNFGLPKWKEEQQRQEEEPWEWQIPPDQRPYPWSIS